MSNRAANFVVHVGEQHICNMRMTLATWITMWAWSTISLAGEVHTAQYYTAIIHVMYTQGTTGIAVCVADRRQVRVRKGCLLPWLSWEGMCWNSLLGSFVDQRFYFSRAYLVLGSGRERATTANRPCIT